MGFQVCVSGLRLMSNVEDRLHNQECRHVSPASLKAPWVFGGPCRRGTHGAGRAGSPPHERSFRSPKPPWTRSLQFRFLSSFFKPRHGGSPEYHFGVQSLTLVGDLFVGGPSQNVDFFSLAHRIQCRETYLCIENSRMHEPVMVAEKASASSLRLACARIAFR